MANFIYQLSDVAPNMLFFGKPNQNNEKFFPVHYRRFSLPKDTKEAIFDLIRSRLKQTLIKERQAELKPLQVFYPDISVQFADGKGERHSIKIQEQNERYLVFLDGGNYYSPVCLGEIETNI